MKEYLQKRELLLTIDHKEPYKFDKLNPEIFKLKIT